MPVPAVPSVPAPAVAKGTKKTTKEVKVTESKAGMGEGWDMLETYREIDIYPLVN